MSSYVFTSLVGNQLFGVINAIICAANRRNTLYPISKIVLYATADLMNLKTEQTASGTIKEAQVIKAFCEDNNYPPVEIIEIDRLKNNFIELISDIVKTGEGILFYLEGGMNYAVSQYISALMNKSPDAALIVTDGPMCHTVKLDTSFLSNSADWDQSIMIRELSPEKILKIQGISDTSSKVSNFSNYVKYWLKNENCIPDNTLTNVRMGGITADFVWNIGGNHLAFLMSPNRQGKPANNKSILKRLRYIAQWVASKPKDKKLYDIKCYVLCEIKAHQESLAKESRGKAIPIKSAYGYCNGLSLFKSASEEIKVIPPVLKKELIEIFSDRIKSEIIGECRNKKIIVNSNTLIVAVGTDVSPVLTAVWSHVQDKRFTTVMMLCSDSLVDNTDNLKKALEEQSIFSNIKIRVVAVDIKGRYIPFRLEPAPDAQNIEVNITPGSKGQTAFLTYFAFRHNLKIWSINKAEITKLWPYDSEKFPVTAYDPTTLLRIDRNKLEKSSIKPEEKQFLTSILADIKDADRPLKLEEILLSKNIHIETKEGETELYVKNFNDDSPAEKLGAWFEKMTLAALASIRGSQCYSNVTRMHENLNGHITEIDCLCSYNHLVLAVSCKAYPSCKNVEKLQERILSPKEEAVTFAKAVGRFCLPVLCLLEKYDIPDIVTLERTSAKIAVIDLHDLADTQRLVQIFNELETNYQSSEADIEIL
ncbi:MAG TPA: hypothetical protein DCR21_04615 [Succinivibrionaceae bacterium]|nr:hypothetical protein [Succinivibrionaceae bacterium]